jgi:hypothetical protein
MRDATVQTLATKLFKACGASWLADSYMHWLAAVRGWSVGSTRPMHYEDQQAIIFAIQKLDDAEMALRRALEDDEDAE